MDGLNNEMGSKKMAQLTVKFVSTDDEKFKEFSKKILSSLGNRNEFFDGVYVEMVAASDIGKQIDDIQDVITSRLDDEDMLARIDDILAGE